MDREIIFAVKKKIIGNSNYLMDGKKQANDENMASVGTFMFLLQTGKSFDPMLKSRNTQETILMLNVTLKQLKSRKHFLQKNLKLKDENLKKNSNKKCLILILFVFLFLNEKYSAFTKILICLLFFQVAIEKLRSDHYPKLS